jgi:hypothetical protein
MKRNALTSIIISLVLLGCKSINEKSDSFYRSCLNEKTKKKLIDGYGVKKDIFTLLKEAEFSLLENKIIPDVSKESYLKLTSIAFNDKLLSKKIATNVMSNVNNDFFNFLSLSSLDFFSECPAEVYNKVKDDNEKKKLSKRFTVYAELAAKGYNDEGMISELINETENFSESETQRLALLHLILMNISK